METDTFLMELLKGVGGNTTAITELRRVIDQLPVRSEFKDAVTLSNRVDLNVEGLKEDLSKVVIRLERIDAWQKIKLPFIIGTITLILYSLGFFFTLNRVAGMIEVKHPVANSQPQNFKF
jgi:hypothetical protein